MSCRNTEFAPDQFCNIITALDDREKLVRDLFNATYVVLQNFFWPLCPRLYNYSPSPLFSNGNYNVSLDSLQYIDFPECNTTDQ